MYGTIEAKTNSFPAICVSEGNRRDQFEKRNVIHHMVWLATSVPMKIESAYVLAFSCLVAADVVPID